MPEEPAQTTRNVVAKLDGIYDLRRDCLLNELYYGSRLDFLTRISLWLEIIIVIGSGASGVSGWVIWTTYPSLKAVWACVAAVAIFLAALKPVLHFDAKLPPQPHFTCNDKGRPPLFRNIVPEQGRIDVSQRVRLATKWRLDPPRRRSPSPRFS